MIPVVSSIVVVNISPSDPPVLRPLVVTSTLSSTSVSGRVLTDGPGDDALLAGLGESAYHPDYLSDLTKAMAEDGSVAFKEWRWP